MDRFPLGPLSDVPAGINNRAAAPEKVGNAAIGITKAVASQRMTSFHLATGFRGHPSVEQWSLFGRYAK